MGIKPGTIKGWAGGSDWIGRPIDWKPIYGDGGSVIWRCGRLNFTTE